MINIELEQLEQIKEIIKLSLQGENAKNYADHDMLRIKLNNIDKHLEQINSKVQKHEKIQNERSLIINDYHNFRETRNDTCPKSQKIITISNDVEKNKLIKKVIVKAIVIGIAFITIIITLIEFLLKN